MHRYAHAAHYIMYMFYIIQSETKSVLWIMHRCICVKLWNHSITATHISYWSDWMVCRPVKGNGFKYCGLATSNGGMGICQLQCRNVRCLLTPRRYPNQCGVIFKYIPGENLPWRLSRISNIYICKNAFKCCVHFLCIGVLMDNTVNAIKLTPQSLKANVWCLQGQPTWGIPAGKGWPHSF